MYFFLAHLSIADLVTGFFNVLPQLGWEIASRFYGGNVLCKMIKFLQILGPYLSSYVLVMTSIDRYQAICHPLSNSLAHTRRSRWMVAVAWIMSLLFCTPQTFIFSYQKISPTSDDYECWATFPVSLSHIITSVLNIFINKRKNWTFTHKYSTCEIESLPLINEWKFYFDYAEKRANQHSQEQNLSLSSHVCMFRSLEI